MAFGFHRAGADVCGYMKQILQNLKGGKTELVELSLLQVREAMFKLGIFAVNLARAVV